MNGLTFFFEFSANVIAGRVLPWSHPHPHPRNHDLLQLCLDTLHEAWPSITKCSRGLPSSLWCSHSFCLWGGEWLPLSVGKHVFWQRTNQSWRRRRLTMTKLAKPIQSYNNFCLTQRKSVREMKSKCKFCRMLWQMQKKTKTEHGKLWNWRESKHHSPRQVKLQKLFVCFTLKGCVVFWSETCCHFWIERHWVVHVLASSVR